MKFSLARAMGLTLSACDTFDLMNFKSMRDQIFITNPLQCVKEKLPSNTLCTYWKRTWPLASYPQHQMASFVLSGKENSGYASEIQFTVIITKFANLLGGLIQNISMKLVGPSSKQNIHSDVMGLIRKFSAFLGNQTQICILRLHCLGR